MYMGHRGAARKNGFTLVEVMIGIGLAGTLVLTMLLLATTALRGDSKASDRQIASAVAEAQLDLLSRRVASQDSAARLAFWQAPDGPYSGAGITPTLVSNGTEYRLAYEIEFLQDPGGNILGMGGNRLRQVRLTVAWWQGEQGRPGYGQFTIARTRVFRESDVRS